MWEAIPPLLRIYSKMKSWSKQQQKLDAHFLGTMSSSMHWHCETLSLWAFFFFKKLLSWQILDVHAPASSSMHFIYTTQAICLSSDFLWIIILRTIDIFIHEAKSTGNMLVYFCFLCCLVGCFCSNRTKRGSCMKYSYYLWENGWF